MALDHTHDPAARSWLASAQAGGCDFPIQNLPFAEFRLAGTQEAFRGGVAIGDQVVDLAALAAAGTLDGPALQAARACAQPVLNDFFALGPAAWRALRHALFAALNEDAPAADADAVRACLRPQAAIEFALPARVGDYTDFYTSIDHALNIGRLLKPDDPITPNFQWIPIAYHGRVSTLGVSGQAFHRPMGQTLAPGAKAPSYGPCARLDYELELGIYIGRGNAAGEAIPLERAEDHVFGICLLNDWSARDIQFWEMAPLGPFLAKNFATTVSPWIVTMDALAPYRSAWTRPAEHPQPLPYLDSQGNREHGAIDIRLEVWLESQRDRDEADGPTRLSGTSFRHQYWSIAQMVAHHTAGGCSLNPGDLFGSGTISGPGPGEAGAMIELTRGGQAPIALANGESRGFLQDGDAVMLRGWCEKPGAARIGFGESRGTVLACRLPG
ncbi:fumarylacetoacetase [Variovorax saccharolyticus]|uniref:fumarylacetoacetase n=1 Tax=Variovorax saccharolyticus TaxID=3053516 RepID=UPI0025751D4E|nr:MULTISPECIES: fumarylacetoacetase [unclassified Variovorax]MDM0021686.1 fumarylacetoacetase [Variovorax sp. J22R187]MDM0028059.1 fumarylacetoacetase [Variovorax sp. J31P216]